MVASEIQLKLCEMTRAMREGQSGKTTEGQERRNSLNNLFLVAQIKSDILNATSILLFYQVI